MYYVCNELGRWVQKDNLQKWQFLLTISTENHAYMVHNALISVELMALSKNSVPKGALVL